MQIPLFMIYSKFLFGYYTNPKLAISRDFAEGVLTPIIGFKGLSLDSDYLQVALFCY